MTSVNAFATLLEAFFNIFLWTHTHTHRHEGIALPLLRMRTWGNKLQPESQLDMADMITVEGTGKGTLLFQEPPRIKLLYIHTVLYCKLTLLWSVVIVLWNVSRNPQKEVRCHVFNFITAARLLLCVAHNNYIFKKFPMPRPLQVGRARFD